MHCLILDLKDDLHLIGEYEAYHQNVWPEVKKSILDSGIEKMEIFRAGNRLVMLMYVNETFSFEAKARADASNPKVQDWEELMWRYQQALPFAEKNQKWVPADKIFEINR
jgi:L-rhamnose mutarotase